MDELKTQLEDALAEVETLIESTQTSIDALEEQKDALDAQIFDLNELLTEYQGTKANLETNIAGLSRLEPVDPEDEDEMEEDSFVDPEEELEFEDLEYIDDEEY